MGMDSFSSGQYGLLSTRTSGKGIYEGIEGRGKNEMETGKCGCNFFLQCPETVVNGMMELVTRFLHRRNIINLY